MPGHQPLSGGPDHSHRPRQREIRSGYTFAITNCDKTTINNEDHFNSFEVTAVPRSIGNSGRHGFCGDESNSSA